MPPPGLKRGGSRQCNHCISGHSTENATELSCFKRFKPFCVTINHDGLTKGSLPPAAIRPDGVSCCTIAQYHPRHVSRTVCCRAACWWSDVVASVHIISYIQPLIRPEAPSLPLLLLRQVPYDLAPGGERHTACGCPRGMRHVITIDRCVLFALLWQSCVDPF